jgi:myo-inositol-1(or 4)-monophosphatase
MQAEELREKSIEIGEAAAQLALGFVGKSLQVERKGRVDLVTKADHACEELILGSIANTYPGHAILSEEAGWVGPQDAEFLWVVDPLDGTTNFAHGLPIWSISIAVLRRGQVWVGVVVDPNRGETFSACRGGGAHLNGTPIHVSEAKSLSDSLLVTGFPYDVQTSRANNLDHFENFTKRAQAVRRLGSAALDLSYVACGRFDGFWELKLHAWDVAAGVLLVEEAGGKVTRFAEEGFDIHAGELVAGPEELVEAMRAVLQDGLRAEELRRACHD